ncbi:probable WRKY transcription factor 50 [Sesamum indicum]|uniref:Probable WRKY transcription factor 50 n=1 Tax=Sesamum indicum TaxID=4182 RepID=A0A6I9UKJ0_SESIN|nr:probable WRKY transcription factor 50 [Sesamum indicum]
MHTQLMIMADYDPNTNMPGDGFGSEHDAPVAAPHDINFQVSDFFEFSDWIEENPAFSSIPAGYNSQNPNYTPHVIVANSTGISSSSSSFSEGTINRDSGSGREKKEIKDKVAFKTKSEVEVLDDGFKWRKYGKKMVKNSPNPRNYYRCSVEGCPVKKRVERYKEDPRYVVTTYEGIHNHQGPQL